MLLWRSKGCLCVGFNFALVVYYTITHFVQHLLTPLFRCTKGRIVQYTGTAIVS
jgi:hypothetical protein